MNSHRVEHHSPGAVRRRGTALVEAAIILPLVLLLTFALIEYSWMFLRQQQITNCARVAARLGATADGNNAVVDSRITSMLNGYGLGSSGYSTTVTPDIGTLARGSTLTVQISVPYANIDITGMNMFPTPATISASVSMEKEGP